MFDSSVDEHRINNSKDKKYLDLFLTPITTCKNYRPKFGTGNKESVTFDKFKRIYSSDPFYSWLGLDSELMYTAHKASGGMTSIYRQVGKGCEELFRQIVIDSCHYENPEYAKWSFKVRTSSNKESERSLDARLDVRYIKNEKVLNKVNKWVADYCNKLDENIQIPEKGIVFEVRQGYKSKDSKRQNADIENAAIAWSSGYLPVFFIFSSQIDIDLVFRYKNNRCGILIGSSENDPQVSVYSFTKEILGYDLENFFSRNSEAIKFVVTDALRSLLSVSW